MKKTIITFILGGIIFSAITAVAVTSLTADQVNYDENTTVKDKIDGLYTTASKYGRLSFKLYADSRSTNRLGRALISTGDFRDKYTKFKVSAITDVPLDGSATSNCTLVGYKNNATVAINPNTDYSIDYTVQIELKNFSSIDNVTSRCYVVVTFFN